MVLDVSEGVLFKYHFTSQILVFYFSKMSIAFRRIQKLLTISYTFWRSGKPPVEKGFARSFAPKITTGCLIILLEKERLNLGGFSITMYLTYHNAR